MILIGGKSHLKNIPDIGDNYFAHVRVAPPLKSIGDGKIPELEQTEYELYEIINSKIGLFDNFLIHTSIMPEMFFNDLIVIGLRAVADGATHGCIKKED